MSEQSRNVFDVDQAVPDVMDPLDQLKQEYEIMSHEASIVKLGTLKDLMPSTSFKGNISVKQRLAEGSATVEGLANAHEALHSSYVAVTKGASIRCVDGRGEEGYDDNDPAAYELGPQIQGGTPGIVSAKRLRTGAEDGATMEKDIEAEVEAGHPFKVAGHTAAGVPADGFGCGEMASQQERLAYFADEVMLGEITSVTEAAMKVDGKTIEAEQLKTELQAGASSLAEVAETYFAGKPKILEFMKQFNEHAEQVLAGKHNEFVLELNYVRGTTLNSGKLNTLTDGNYNAFNLDMWYIIDELGEDAPFIVASALSTLIKLTDGSIEVEARLPAEQAVAA